jgi:acyl-CoA reductase-like NAD-dependent aldehyde dehydrogenase
MSRVALTIDSGCNYVDGRWRAAASGETYTKVNPMRSSETVGTFASSGEQDAAAAVAAAERAFEPWAALPRARRASFLEAAAKTLLRHADEIAHDMASEMGKPIREARGEVGRAATILRYVAGAAYKAVGEQFEQALTGAQVSTRRRPLGVVGLITPWNFPIATPIWKLAPALVYGNTVVLKPGYEAPRSGLHLATAFEEAGLPPGVLNVVAGRGSTAGDALVRDPRVRAISFTGSVATGHSVRDVATAQGKRVQLELGGQNPLVVMADADLGRAVEAAFAGAFWSAGQKCTATRRIYVQADVYERFREMFLARVARARVGDPLDDETEVGPLVSDSQLAEVLGAIERATVEGCTLLAGGSRMGSDGYLLEPTVFEDVPDHAFLSCEEVFGPVVSLYRFDTFDEAVRRANAVTFGLSAAIFTSNLAAATRFQNEAQAGLIHVNSQTAGAEVHVPFGGIKSSGFGPHEQGQAAIEFYTDQVTIYVDP